jgi:hypothetical protein
MYASQNFAFFDSLRSGFPADSHQQNLATALAIRPRLLVPASAGFRFAGEHQWLNRFLFPVSRERFAADLHALDPNLSVALLDPGDAVLIDGSGLRTERGASSLARTVERETEAIRFDPTAPIPPLRDPNPGRCPRTELCERVRVFLEQELQPHCARTLADPGSLAARYRREGAVYELEVVFPEKESRVWTLDFRDDRAGLREGRDPLATVFHRIAASALTGWLERRLSWFTVRAYSRRYTTLARVLRAEKGVGVEPVILPDLLMHYLVYESPDSSHAARRRIDREIAALRRGDGGAID